MSEARGSRRAVPRDVVEWRLVRLFAEVLERPRVGATESFDALGGDSLRAADLFSRVAEEFGVELPLTTLVEASTPRALADLVRGRGRPPRAAPCVRLNDVADGAAVLLVPGAGGDAYAMIELAAAFAPERPAWGASYPGLDGSAPFARTVEAMADWLLPAALDAAGSRPAVLVGCSFGGLVAFELARRLDACGAPAERLVLVDSRDPSPAPSWFAPLAALWSPVRSRVNEGARPRSLAALARRWWRHERARLHLAAAREVTGVPFARRFVYLREAASLARLRYRPAPLSVPALRIGVDRPGARGPRGARDPRGGWSRALIGPVEHAAVDGAHGDYLRAPLADEVAGLVLRRGARGGPDPGVAGAATVTR